MSFDRLARYYSAMEWLLAGRKLQRCRTAFLAEAISARSILLVGEGHGRFLEELCRAAPEAAVSYVDSSLEMSRVARAQVRRYTDRPIEFQTVPIIEFEPERTFDLIATQFFLDCFAQEELRRTVTKLAGLLEPGGAWMVADFQVPTRGWRRRRALFVLVLAYGFFRMVTRLPAKRLIAPQPFLKAEGLKLEKRVEFNFGLLYAELWRKSTPHPGPLATEGRRDTPPETLAS
jgi:ubiquinone/menaquinone biosynthesis C-methylase UbiE